jgi:hypothetical protein
LHPYYSTIVRITNLFFSPTGKSIHVSGIHRKE